MNRGSCVSYELLKYLGGQLHDFNCVKEVFDINYPISWTVSHYEYE